MERRGADWRRIVVAVVLAAVSAHGPAGATPTTLMWSPCSIDIQAFEVVHLTADNYFTVGRGGPGRRGQAFPADLGLTVGVLPFKVLQMEVGIDWLEPSDSPLLLNAKLGTPEGVLFAGAPALQAGFFNAGTKRGVTNLDVADVITGRSLPAGLGRLHAAAYAGNAAVLRSSRGARANTGVMAGYDAGPWPKAGPLLSRLAFGADWVSGRNAIGGGGVCVNWLFAPNASVLTGPVWFADPGINGAWKWTVQLDANF